MIAKQKIHNGNNFIGAFDYNDKKMNHKYPQQRAELLDHNFVEYNREFVTKEILFLQRLRPKLTRDAYHVSLNFAPGDNLSKEQLVSIVKDYMKGMGFDDNLFSLWQHHDAEHCHAHLLVFRTRFDGTLVSDSNNYRRSEALCRQLELKYNLQVVKSSKEAQEKAPNKDEIEMMQRTGTLSNRILLQEKIKKSMAESSSILDFINNCRTQGVYLLFNQSKSTGRVSGITYLMDGGFMARGQALGNMFKWNNLTKTIDYEQSRDFQAISESNSGTKSRFATVLERHLPEDVSNKSNVNSDSRNSEHSIARNSGYNGNDGNVEKSGTEPKEADGLRNGNQKISQNTDVDLLHPLHSIGGSLYSAIGTANNAEIDDDHKNRRKRRGS
ncbi:relaxase/mobilization nuclease domain-containing protein [Pedobacter jamesrossensis]|uniref:Relaxase/mobilization nuclease domain-containing protein n=1 Tax=Pedobacter jamesrossensis TaxID=1908238 RepID=A0ABV8NFP8_9SPHI